MTRPYYITTPIFYVNDKPHIGHAYTSLACDVLARFHRLDGASVRALTGTDEHGQKIEQAARARNIEPQNLTDEVSMNFRNLSQLLNFSFDDFIRTSEPRHHKAVIAFWNRLMERDKIYLDRYQGWYSVRDETFFSETELTENPSGERVAPTGAAVEWVEEPSFFFRLSDMQDRLLRHYEEHPSFIAPDYRRNEVLSFVRGGLRDLSVSRSTVRWGVKVPDHPDHTIYVWVDALINYLSALGFPNEEAKLHKQYWPPDLQIVGKDIVRFHAVYWPAMLMAADLPLPKRIFAHGWWTNEGQKMSKSTGNVIHPEELVTRYGLDPIRYFLLRELPFGRDGDFQHRAIANRINSDLANDYGNLAQRVLSLTARHFGDRPPSLPEHPQGEELALLDKVTALSDCVRERMAEQAFHLALEAIWSVIGEANRYIDRCAPWALVKTDPKRGEEILASLLETLRCVAILTQAFMPDSSARLLDQLGIEKDARSLADLSRRPVQGGAPATKPEGIFPRYVEEANDVGR